MAIVKNFWLVNQKKRLGGAVIYQAMGQTRSRELAASVSNPRTISQMSQRVKWANLVNLYRVNRDWMKYAFETKKQNQSEYNKFMSLNVTNSRIFLTKQMAAAGSCVVTDYLITQGTLPSVEITQQPTHFHSNIYFDQAGVLSADATISQVSRSLLAANPILREGDQLSFIRLTQMTNAATGFPYVVVRRYEVLIDTTSNEKFYDYMPADYIVQQAFGNNQCLSVVDSGNAGGFALIISRTIAGKTYVSTQRIIVANNAATIGQYSSEAALQAAISSYGESDDAFLSTVTANMDQQAATQLAVTLFRIDGVVYTPGQRYANLPGFSGKRARVEFNQTEDINSVKVRGVFLSEGVFSTTEYSDMDEITGGFEINSLPDLWGLSEESVLYQIQVIADEQVFTLQYHTINDDWLEGLE